MKSYKSQKGMTVNFNAFLHEAAQGGDSYSLLGDTILAL